MIRIIGMIKVLTTSLCGPSLLRIKFGSTTNFLAKNQILILWDCWPIPGQIIAIFYDVTFGDALSLFWDQNCRITTSCLNVIVEHAWVNFWVFPMSIILLWQIFLIWVLDNLVFDDLFGTFICTKDDENVFNGIQNDMFDLIRGWYVKYEHDDNCELIYQPPPLEYVWIDVQGCRNRRHELDNQRRRWEDHICENNFKIPDIIHLTDYSDAKPPTGVPVSDDESTVDSLLGYPPTESGGDFLCDDADDEPSDSPSLGSNIPSPSQPSPPNNFQEGDISREGA